MTDYSIFSLILFPKLIIYCMLFKVIYMYISLGYFNANNNYIASHLFRRDSLHLSLLLLLLLYKVRIYNFCNKKTNKLGNK